MSAPNWQSKTAVIVCAGPSLSDEQLDHVSRSDVKAIAVNTAYIYAPWADVAYAGDMMFWRVHHARIAARPVIVFPSSRTTPCSVKHLAAVSASRAFAAARYAATGGGKSIDICRLTRWV